MGRGASGVTGIRLVKGDEVTSMEVVEPGGDLLVVSKNGFGKRTSLSVYPSKRRASRGILTIHKGAKSKIGTIAAARVVQEEDDLTLISAGGVVLRTKVKNISKMGRTTRGVAVMNVDEGDSVVSIARTAAADLKRVGAE